jgi:hypothetical protein
MKKGMDLIIELKIKNLRDWEIIQPLLQRLRISFTKKEIYQAVSQEENPDTELQELQAMLAEGVDASYYGDPVEYQKNVRAENEHPFRT